MQIPRTALVAAFALVLAAPTGALAAHTSRSAAAPLPNLIVNGDAEQGTPNVDGSIVPTPGWTTTAGQFTEVLYGSSFPNTDTATKIGGGKNFFAGGPDPDNGVSAANQVVSVASYATAIDAGSEPVTLSALVGGYASQNDNATVVATFLDVNNAPLGTALTVGPVDAAARQNETTLLPETNTATVPAGTRSVNVVITLTRTDGAYDDGYVDNVSLTLGTASTSPTTPPAGTPVKAPGPPDVALQTGPGGKGFRVQVQYTVPKACTKGCSAHAQLRIRTGGRVYAVKLPGDSPIVLGTRTGLILPAHKKVRFYLTVSKAALLSSPFTTVGKDRVAETRLRVWVKTPKGEILTVRDGHIKISIARIDSGALPGLKGIL
jgi:hypothetical protein